MYLPVSQSEYISNDTPSLVIQKHVVKYKLSWLALPEESPHMSQINKSLDNS